MPQNTTYFLGRVIKLGSITNAGVVAAIREPTLVRRGSFVFTFTDIVASDDRAVPRFVFARLTKFTPEGAIAVVEPERHIATQADVANLLVASSPFMYLPEFSGVIYQNLWNKLEKTQFEKAFSQLIEEKFARFFVQSAIEPVADLLTFVQQISRLETVERIDATVHPPNPLFGRAWRSLRDYMARRRVSEVRVRETASDQATINTTLPALATAAIEGATENRFPNLENDLRGEFGDAAVLMAADGYGKARIVGRRAQRRVAVHTRDSQISFSFEREPEPEALFAESAAIFRRIEEERYLEHP